MTITLIQKTGLAAACTLALALMSTAVGAQTIHTPLPQDSMLLNDSQGQAVMSQFGDCWHAGQAPRAESSAACDPNYRAPVAAAAPVAAPAPYVAPVVVAKAAPAPVYEKITLDADALFDFNKAVLRPAGRDALDKFVSGIQGINPATISAVGHTDRIGSASYNQNLSERRVAAVKTYLVSKGVSPDSVRTSGVGETQPTTKAGDCVGKKSPKLIACLQPDRRVDLEVSGMRTK